MKRLEPKDEAIQLGIAFALPVAINKPNRISLLWASAGVDLIIEVLNDLYSNSWITDTSKEEISTKIKYWDNVKSELKNIKFAI